MPDLQPCHVRCAQSPPSHSLLENPPTALTPFVTAQTRVRIARNRLSTHLTSSLQVPRLTKPSLLKITRDGKGEGWRTCEESAISIPERQLASGARGQSDEALFPSGREGYVIPRLAHADLTTFITAHVTWCILIPHRRLFSASGILRFCRCGRQTWRSSERRSSISAASSTSRLSATTRSGRSSRTSRRSGTSSTHLHPPDEDGIGTEHGNAAAL